MDIITAPNANGAFFPLDEALGLQERKPWSLHLKWLVTRLAGRIPYDQTREVLAEIGGIELAKSSVWHIVQESGAQMGAEIAAEEAEQKAAARTWSTPGGRIKAARRMGISIDGAMINVIGEGWKELKLACVFDVEQETRVDEHTGDAGEFGCAVQQSYVAHLGGPEAFGWQAWSEAQRRGWRKARDTQMLADAARWIWNLYAEHFHESIGVVDWFHAVENLGKAKQLIYPQEGPVAKRWFNAHKTALRQGHARRIAKSLNTAADQSDVAEDTKALHTAAGYFSHNHDRMQYQDFRDAGWLIGSGTIESGAKQFKMRFSGPGMRWSRQGAENLLPVRAAVMTSTERFDDLWARAYKNSPPN